MAIFIIIVVIGVIIYFVVKSNIKSDKENKPVASSMTQN